MQKIAITISNSHKGKKKPVELGLITGADITNFEKNFLAAADPRTQRLWSESASQPKIRHLITFVQKCQEERSTIQTESERFKQGSGEASKMAQRCAFLRAHTTVLESELAKSAATIHKNAQDTLPSIRTKATQLELPPENVLGTVGVPVIDIDISRKSTAEILNEITEKTGSLFKERTESSLGSTLKEYLRLKYASEFAGLFVFSHDIKGRLEGHNVHKGLLDRLEASNVPSQWLANLRTAPEHIPSSQVPGPDELRMILEAIRSNNDFLGKLASKMDGVVAWLSKNLSIIESELGISASKVLDQARKASPELGRLAAPVFDIELESGRVQLNAFQSVLVFGKGTAEVAMQLYRAEKEYLNALGAFAATHAQYAKEKEELGQLEKNEPACLSAEQINARLQQFQKSIRQAEWAKDQAEIELAKYS